MDERLPLSALLSHVLVAFTIEFDNEAEQQLQHRTTRHGSTGGSVHAPWLVSMVMWLNCMQFLDDSEGITIRELERRARTKTNLAGMQRWGYIAVETGSTQTGWKRPHLDLIIRPTSAGRKAQEVWRPLFGVIEERWRKRFGPDEVDRLRESLWQVLIQFDVELPDCLPILKYGLFSQGSESEQPAPFERRCQSRASLPLPAALSKVLLALALEFERESELSLAISANVLRVLNQTGVRVQDLPSLTGVSKESIQMAMGILRKKGIAVIDPNPAKSRATIARLTAKGRLAQDAYQQRLQSVEQRWRSRFGEVPIERLRGSLESWVGQPTAELSPLFRGLDPCPNGWRASVPRPRTLPYFPMVLHRGGFPDGS
jgi:DNA-binding MarR family transcriptional regulator